ncbi:MAG TPA: gfo/Idh/MocA family oxidoreductase, partial [Thermoanaerobaculia bacterium]|nr:gfo/Idh/MocA family oxidoreductase [Thermoanaerobaculia bacterium]
RKQRFFASDVYISVDTKEQEAKGFRLAEEEGLRVMRPFELKITKKEPLRAELEAFLGCVRDRSQPVVTAQDGLEAVELAVRVGAAIDESVRKFWI